MVGQPSRFDQNNAILDVISRGACDWKCGQCVTGLISLIVATLERGNDQLNCVTPRIDSQLNYSRRHGSIKNHQDTFITHQSFELNTTHA